MNVTRRAMEEHRLSGLRAVGERGFGPPALRAVGGECAGAGVRGWGQEKGDSPPGSLPLPAGLYPHSIDTGEYADYLILYVNGEPRQDIPDAAGPQVLAAEDMVRSWLRARHMTKRLIRVALWGPTARAFRQGYNTVPDRAVGTVTWAQPAREVLGKGW